MYIYINLKYRYDFQSMYQKKGDYFIISAPVGLCKTWQAGMNNIP